MAKTNKKANASGSTPFIPKLSELLPLPSTESRRVLWMSTIASTDAIFEEANRRMMWLTGLTRFIAHSDATIEADDATFIFELMYHTLTDVTALYTDAITAVNRPHQYTES
ncbi:hypothetical protein BTM_1454 [Burkholderia thailandensis 34]|uniref:hypothetical protein n=1 Tax=Burkholderia thailandensis TaxID=57975 RepID=UPI0005D79BFF|nr:hypothetical protein [Burkholderia thailandensis]AJY30286.1 hypothetical protein BTM_1454 [Burkholderia thailandensis 34]